MAIEIDRTANRGDRMPALPEALQSKGLVAGLPGCLRPVAVRDFPEFKAA
jgi:hypothetical protein